MTILRAATHETELGDHDFCLSWSHTIDGIGMIKNNADSNGSYDYDDDDCGIYGDDDYDCGDDNDNDDDDDNFDYIGAS